LIGVKSLLLTAAIPQLSLKGKIIPVKSKYRFKQNRIKEILDYFFDYF